MILGMLCGALGALCDDIGYVMWCSGGVMMMILGMLCGALGALCDDIGLCYVVILGMCGSGGVM